MPALRSTAKPLPRSWTSRTSCATCAPSFAFPATATFQVSTPAPVLRVRPSFFGTGAARRAGRGAQHAATAPLSLSPSPPPATDTSLVSADDDCLYLCGNSLGEGRHVMRCKTQPPRARLNANSRRRRLVPPPPPPPPAPRSLAQAHPHHRQRGARHVGQGVRRPKTRHSPPCTAVAWPPFPSPLTVPAPSPNNPQRRDGPLPRWPGQAPLGQH